MKETRMVYFTPPLCAVLMLLVCCFITACSSDELPNAVEKLRGISNPDDISQIKNWKKRCREEHGEEVMKKIEDAVGELATCILQYVKPDKLQHEVNRSMAKGNLDRVFKKYCGYREKILVCVDEFLGTVRVCITEQQRDHLNITRRAIDAAIDFTCHDDGDRIALFMAEEGVECLKEHKGGIRECIEEKEPKLHEAAENPDSITGFDIDNLIIDDEQCGVLRSVHHCIVDETEKCSDPTPANILNALIIAMLKVTPCWEYNIRQDKQEEEEAAQAAAAVAAATSGATTISGAMKIVLGNVMVVMASGWCVVASGLASGWFAVVNSWYAVTSSVGGLMSSLAGNICQCNGLWLGVVSQYNSLWAAGTTALKNAYTSGVCMSSEAISHSWSVLSSVEGLSGMLVVALSAVTAANLLI